MKTCNYSKCEKKVAEKWVAEKWIKTELGWFCSEECRSAVANRLGMVLMGFLPTDTEKQ